jgi:hypothetical protein
MTLAGNTVYPYGSIDTNFDPAEFSLDSTFNYIDDNAQFNQLLTLLEVGHGST